MTLKNGSRSTIYNRILSLKVINQHAKLDEPSFILSQNIMQKPPSSENRPMAPMTLKSGSRSTIHIPMLAHEVMQSCIKCEEPMFIISQDIMWKPSSIENGSTADVTFKSGSRSAIYNPMLAREVM